VRSEDAPRDRLSAMASARANQMSLSRRTEHWPEDRGRQRTNPASELETRPLFERTPAIHAKNSRDSQD
jgi:hypothetical protein